MGKIKKISLVLVAILFLLTVGIIYSYYQSPFSSKPTIVNLEEVEGLDFENQNINNPNDLVGIIEKAKETVFTDGRVNPRARFYYQGQEVAYIDHSGKIGGIGNLTFNTTGGGYGFFNYVGSELDRITKGWFDSLDTSNITSSQYCNSTGCYTIGDFLVDTDTSLNEDQVEAYVFDSDNTANLGMGGYNITNVECIVGGNGGAWCFA